MHMPMQRHRPTIICGNQQRLAWRLLEVGVVVVLESMLECGWVFVSLVVVWGVEVEGDASWTFSMTPALTEMCRWLVLKDVLEAVEVVVLVLGCGWTAVRLVWEVVVEVVFELVCRWTAVWLVFVVGVREAVAVRAACAAWMA